MAMISQEAFNESRRLIDSLPAHDNGFLEIIHSLHKNDWTELPPAGSAEAEELIQDYKPVRYAYLAKAIRVVFDEALDDGQCTSPFSLNADEVRDTTHPWRTANAAIEDGLFAAMHRVAAHPDCQTADVICQAIGRLNPDRYFNLESQLTAGIQTASNTITRTLMNIPSLAESFAPETKTNELAAIAKGSSSIVFELMKRSVASMMAAREAITFTGFWDAWTTYDPIYFRPIFHLGRLSSLKLANIEDVEFDGRKIRDFTDPDRPTIGCPFSLLHGSYKRLWTLSVDAVDQAELWSEA